MAWAVLAALVVVTPGVISQARAQVPAAASAAHQVGDPFTVHDIQVDVTAANANAARDQAIAEAQARAFQELFKRLAGSGKSAPKLGQADLERLVQGFEIDEERASAVRYVATISVKFRAQATRNYLLGQGIAFTDAPARPTLILPVDETGPSPVLWEDRTAWAGAWEDYKNPGALVPLLVPAGELPDVSTIGAREAIEGAPGPLAAIAQRYGAGDVLVARLMSGQGGGVRIGLARHTLDGGAPFTDQVAISPQGGESPEALLQRAVAAVMNKVEDAWRQVGTIQGGAEATLPVTVPLTRLEDWLETRRRLSQINLVSKTELLSLSRTSADLILHFFGESEKLAAALAQRDLGLIPPAPPAVPLPGMPAPPPVSSSWELRLGAVQAVPAAALTAPAPGAPAPLTSSFGRTPLGGAPRSGTSF